MSLEDQVKENTAALTALNKNISALLAGKSATTSAEPPADGKKAKKPKGIDINAVKAVGEKLRDVTDKPTVVKLLKKIGKVATVAELDEKHYPAFIAAAEAAIKAKEAEDDDDDDSDDDEDDDDDC